MKNLNDLIKKTIKKEIQTQSKNVVESMKTYNDLKKRCNPEKYDLLLTKIGTTGIPKVIDVDKKFSLFVSVALLKFPYNKVNPYFLELVISSPFVKEQSKAGTQGIGNKNLLLNTIKAITIPFPPLIEQEKIVEKEEVLGNTIYISKMGSQNDVRFTVFMNEKFIRFENKCLLLRFSR